MGELVNDLNVTPVLPGSIFYFETSRPATVPPSQGSTVFVPFTHDWGPDNVALQWNSYVEYLLEMGVSDTVARRRVYHAFLGEGLPGRGGAGSVIGYRMATAAAARATKTLQNTTPADAITLTARYKGTRANAFKFTVRAGAVAGTNDLVILDGTREAEVYNHTTTDVAALVADINQFSSLVTATLLIDGVALAAVSATAMAGGLDGQAVLAADWTTMLNALEFEPFTVFAAAGLTDTAIIASLRAWKNEVKLRGKPLFLAVGGPAAETFTAHRTRATGYNDSDLLAFGSGDIVDSVLTDDGSEITISTAEGVARVAGAIARRGEALDMVNVRFAGWRATGGATRAQAEIAASSGQSLLVRDGNRVAPTKIPLGVTSYIDNTAEKPRFVYSNVKFVRTNQALEMAIMDDQEGGEDELIDGRGVTERSRDLVRGRAKAVIKARVDAGVLQPGSDVEFDPDRPFLPTDTQVALIYDAVYVRGLRSIRNRIRVG